MGKKILLADDSAIMKMMLTDILTKNGHEVAASAENGKEALELYIKYRPDVVIMNIVMSEMDGITATKRIIEIDPNAKIFMCSAAAQPYSVLAAFMAGARDFVAKPFQGARILGAIENVQQNDAATDKDAMFRVLTTFNREETMSQDAIDQIYRDTLAGRELSEEDLVKLVTMYADKKVEEQNKTEPPLSLAEFGSMLKTIIKGQEEIIALLKER